jgi:hypothetical protein
MSERKNILFGDIIVLDGKKQVKIKEAVFTEGAELYKQQKILKILNYKIVGQTSITKSYTEVKASDEKRNNITGAYE